MTPDTKRVFGAADEAQPVIAVHAAQAGRTAAGRTAPQFECPICGEGFSPKARYERHLVASHPPPAASAATVERGRAGIDFPASKQDLVSHAEQGREPGSSGSWSDCPPGGIATRPTSSVSRSQALRCWSVDLRWTHPAGRTVRAARIDPYSVGAISVVACASRVGFAKVDGGAAFEDDGLQLANRDSDASTASGDRRPAPGREDKEDSR
jgi:hypothetical protein